MKKQCGRDLLSFSRFWFRLLVIALIVCYTNAYAEDAFKKSRAPSRTLTHKLGSEYADIFNTWRKEILTSMESWTSLQKAWPKTSMWGGIWTYNFAEHDAVKVESYAQALATVVFNVRSNYGFFDIDDPRQQDIWKKWQQENGSKENQFPVEQVTLLREQRLPDHSEFYKSNRLVGVITRGASFPDAFVIVDFAAIERIFVTSPNFESKVFNYFSASCDQISRSIK